MAAYIWNYYTVRNVEDRIWGKPTTINPSICLFLVVSHNFHKVLYSVLIFLIYISDVAYLKMQNVAYFQMIQIWLFLHLDINILFIKANIILDNLNSWFLANRLTVIHEKIGFTSHLRGSVVFALNTLK